MIQPEVADPIAKALQLKWPKVPLQAKPDFECIAISSGLDIIIVGIEKRIPKL